MMRPQILSQMWCETTSSVKECALRARSTHGVHHAIVEVNIVIGVVLGEVLVACVVPLVVDAAIGLALSLIAHVVVVVFVEDILDRILCMGDVHFTRSLICRFNVGILTVFRERVWVTLCSTTGLSVLSEGTVLRQKN